MKCVPRAKVRGGLSRGYHVRTMRYPTLASLLLVACVSPAPPESAAPPTAQEHLLLDQEGRVHTAEASFALQDAAQAAQLLAWARAWISAHPGHLLQARAASGTSGDHVRELVRLLDSEGVGAYHLRKGRTRR